MKAGDTIEAAIWLAGTETDDLKERYMADVCENIESACANSGLIHGPVTFYELRPGDERVPKVPKNIQGPDVRLFVGECTVYAKSDIRKRGISGDLDRKDLETLRKITRDAYEKENPGQRLTDMECDDYIDSLGERVVLRQLRAAKVVH